MSRKNSKVKLKYKRNIGGLAAMYALSVIVGAVGVAGWLLGPGDLAARTIYAALAFAAAFVVPVGAGQLGRTYASALMIPVMLLGAGWTAYSVEHANKVLVEAPLEAAHNAKQADKLAALASAEKALTDLLAAERAFVPEKVDCNPCRLTKQDAAARDAVKLDRLAASIVAARADVTAAKADVEPYASAVPWWMVLAFGAAIDAALALAIFSLESTARSNRQKAEEALRREREYAAKQSTKSAQPRKNSRAKKQGPEVVSAGETAFLLQARGPRLVVDNG